MLDLFPSSTTQPSIAVATPTPAEGPVVIPTVDAAILALFTVQVPQEIIPTPAVAMVTPTVAPAMQAATSVAVAGLVAPVGAGGQPTGWGVGKRGYRRY
ncbi:hypothetical protein HK101_004825 [Irineochytrium annulatum]|nr:hypothetical protein HK101_004825 [Irineochytrium annulatum]